jgi:hypothetical protein
MKSDPVKFFLVPPDFASMVEGPGIGLESGQEVEVRDEFYGYGPCKHHT